MPGTTWAVSHGGEEVGEAIADAKDVAAALQVA